MFLSTLMINVGENPDRPRPGRLWLRNIYHVHQRLSMAFPSVGRKSCDPQFLQPYRKSDFTGTAAGKDVHDPRTSENGFLFRVEAAPPVVVVQSAREPDWKYAFQNADYLLDAPPMVRRYNPTLAAGDLCRFRLTVNPTRKPRDGKYKGKRVGAGRDPLKLVAWLAAKGERQGFQVVFNGKDTQWDDNWRVITSIVKGHRGKQAEENSNGKLTFASATFDGLLKVTDADLFRTTLYSGIGAAKAFGFGLLSIARTAP